MHLFFIKNVKLIFEEFFPRKLVPLKSQDRIKCWVTDEIRAASKAFRELSQFRKRQESADLNSFFQSNKKAYRVLLVQIKKAYYSRVISEAENRTKTSW
jgi:hypothetical protein